MAVKADKADKAVKVVSNPMREASCAKAARVRDVSAAEEAASMALAALVGDVEAGADPGAVLAAVERIVRRAEAAIVRLIDIADRREVHRDDGHSSVQAWCRATVRWSAAEAADRWRTVRAARDVPDIVQALRDGTVPVGSVRVLGRAIANRRAHEAMVGAAADLLADARWMAVDPFSQLVRRVEDYLDADGAHRCAEHAHTARQAFVGVVGDEVITRASHGLAQGALIREVFEHYVAAEFAADPTRTGAQCRADALHAVFLAAAEVRRGASRPPTVNVVIDQATFEATLAEVVTGRGRKAAGDLASYRCETIDGDPVDPHDAVVAALIGHVRRVVVTSPGVPIDLGRRVRLFRGIARDAIWLAHGRACVYPGCGARHCEVDHGIGWSRRGRTSPSNGLPLCDHHNRWKHERGYRIWRDPNGAWHTARPDGTPITPAA